MPEHPHKASAFMVFPDVHSACAAASILRDRTAVDAVELFDRCASAFHSLMTLLLCILADANVWRDCIAVNAVNAIKLFDQYAPVLFSCRCWL